MADFDEYMADKYDMDDLEDDMNAEFDGRDIDASDFDQLNKAADTCAAQARNGKDIQGCRNEIFNVKDHVAPSEKHPESLLEGFTETQVSTLAVKERLLVAGGFQGELICKHPDRPGVSFCSRTTYTENTITNAVDIYRNSRPSSSKRGPRKTGMIVEEHII